MKATTLCLLIKDNRVLLAMKKRGFGVGKVNGVGGKVQDGETIEMAAARELQEEVGAIAEPAAFERAGDIKFHFRDRPEWDQHMHIFLVRDWKGEIKESEEMAPKWYAHEETPFDSMWPDDKHWLPVVLTGKKIKGKFYFTNEGAMIDDFEIREI